MRKLNLQTWTRLTRLDLQSLSVSMGNAALAGMAEWPASGEGRQVKATAERMMRLLDRTHDRSDLDHAFDTLEAVMRELKSVQANSYFQAVVAAQIHQRRDGERETFGDALESRLTNFASFVATNRPKKIKTAPAAERRDNPPWTPPPQIVEDDLAKRLAEITPGQQMGPVQFEVRKGVLRIKEQTATADPQDLKTIAKARAALEEDAASLLSALTDSNCDPRLIHAVREVETIIQSGADVIRLGLFNFTCDHLFVRFAEEIPDVAAARFQGFSVGVGLYVGQFPEWQRFTENAARAEFENDDVARTYEVGQALLPALRSASALVDPEVPRSIELILEALRSPGLSSRRALFAAIRTLENLFAKIFSEFAGTLLSFSQGAQSGIKKATSIAVAGGLLLAAAHVASNISPTAERVLKATWLKQAAEIVKKGLKDAE